MSNCSKCNDAIITDDEIICSQCNKHYHYLCAGINEVAFKKLTKNTRNRWMCNTCKYNWDKPKNTSPKSLDSEISLQDLANSMNFMSQKFDEFSTTVTKILEEMNEIRKENVRIMNDNKLLTKEIFDLKHRLDNIEQSSLKSTVEIIGIPSIPNEICKETVMNIAQVLNTVITIEEAYRVPISVNGENKIIARLSQPGMKTAIIANCKRNKNLNLSNFNSAWSKDKRIFINNNLTKHRRQLYSKTRTAAKAKNYKFVWVNDNAEILIRHDENSKVRKIYSELDLTSI